MKPTLVKGLRGFSWNFNGKQMLFPGRICYTAPVRREGNVREMNRNWKRKFVTIAVGQMFSLIGSSAVQFALIWWIASETGSAAMMGLAGLAAFLPMALLSPAAGVVADRYSRKAVCICADLFIGLSAAVFALLLWRLELPMWTALVILLVRGVGNTFHQPALQALIPQFVPAEELVRVGGWNQMFASGSYLLGPAIGAALYAALPLPVILLTDLVGALLASALLAAVSIPRAQASWTEKRRFVDALREGVEVFRSDRPLTRMIAVETLSMVFVMPLASFYPLMTSSYFRASAWHGSAVEALYALGMMASALLFGSVIRVRRPLWVSYLGMMGLGLSSAVCGLLPPQMWAWWIFAAACGFMGAFCNVHNIPLVAYMQASIDPARLGRAFALTALLSSVTTPVGLLVAAPLADRLGVHSWFLIAGLGVCLITAAGMLLHARARG